jgi:hypothetical protein
LTEPQHILTVGAFYDAFLILALLPIASLDPASGTGVSRHVRGQRALL